MALPMQTRCRKVGVDRARETTIKYHGIGNPPPIAADKQETIDNLNVYAAILHGMIFIFIIVLFTTDLAGDSSVKRIQWTPTYRSIILDKEWKATHSRCNVESCYFKAIEGASDPVAASLALNEELFQGTWEIEALSNKLPLWWLVLIIEAVTVAGHVYFRMAGYENRWNLTIWDEYSVTASLMMLCFAILGRLNNIFIQMFLLFTTVAVMQLGRQAEQWDNMQGTFASARLAQMRPDIEKWRCFMTALVLFALSWVVIIVNYFYFVEKLDEPATQRQFVDLIGLTFLREKLSDNFEKATKEFQEINDWLKLAILVPFLFFCMYPMVMVVQLRRKNSMFWWGIHPATLYAALSFFSKLALAGLLAVAALQEDDEGNLKLGKATGHTNMSLVPSIPAHQ